MKASTILLATAGLVNWACGRTVDNLSNDNSSLNLDELNGASLRFNKGTVSAPDVVQGASDIVSWDPKRISDDAEVQKYQEKGNWLGCLMDASDAQAGLMWPDPFGRTPKSARSPWAGTLTELRTWFWNEGSYDHEIHCDFTQDGTKNYNHIGNALQALGLSTLPQQAGGDNMCYSIEHFDEDAEDEDGDQLQYIDQKYRVDGQTYSATGAFCRFAINYIGGAIYAQNLESPQTAVSIHWDPPPNDNLLPELRLASDIMFAYWIRNNANPKNLRYYFVNAVMNAITLRLIAKVVNKKGLQNLPPWPGIALGLSESEAEYLLGSPIGATLAFMLIQHKAELGRKHITSVTTFLAPTNKVQLVFTIVDVPIPEGKPGGSGDLRHRQDDGQVQSGQVQIVKINDGGKGFVREHVFSMTGETTNV